MPYRKRSIEGNVQKSQVFQLAQLLGHLRQTIFAQIQRCQPCQALQLWQCHVTGRHNLAQIHALKQAHHSIGSTSRQWLMADQQLSVEVQHSDLESSSACNSRIDPLQFQVIGTRIEDQAPKI